MKRALLSALGIALFSTAVLAVLQLRGVLVAPEAALSRALRFQPNGSISVANYLGLATVSFFVALVLLQVRKWLLRFVLLALLVAEMLGAAFLFSYAGKAFQPLPAIIVSLLATLFALALELTAPARRHRAAASLLRGRVAPDQIDRLTGNASAELLRPQMREVTVVVCEIANSAELLEELSPDDFAALTREFVDRAENLFRDGGGYVSAIDGGGVCAIFGFPSTGVNHAAQASRAVQRVRERFPADDGKEPGSSRTMRLHFGMSSGTVLTSVRQGGGFVFAGQPPEVARRLASTNRTYGSEVLMGPQTFTRARDTIVARPIDFLHGPSDERWEIYELLALADNASAEQLASRDSFWSGVVYFRERRWQEAMAEFTRAAGSNGADDAPLQWYLRRLEPLCSNPAPEPPTARQPSSPL